MRVVIVGGGMAGLVLARGLMARGVEPLVLERSPRGTAVPGPIMLPFQAFDPLEDIGVLRAIRAQGRDVPPFRNDEPVAIGVGRQPLLEMVREGVALEWGAEVVELLRDPAGRVVGCVVRDADGETREVPSDLLVGADGARSPVRGMAGIRAEVHPSATAALSWRSPREPEEPFEIRFLADGRQITMLGWGHGAAGGWQIPRPEGGAEEAKAPGLDAYKEAFARLMPSATGPLEEVTPEGWLYREATEVACETWWIPGVALIGEALHAMDPEAGIGSGLGMGDALALAVAVARNPDDPDAACADWEHWRRPALAPYLALGSKGVRVVRGGPLPPEERWPPDPD
jgi:2-polyprenyl-6-methoxyphenol hydroxylase-like FAD-dependent oxidoreductase